MKKDKKKQFITNRLSMKSALAIAFACIIAFSSLMVSIAHTNKQGPQGPQGEQGPVGPAGPQGENGQNGEDGKTPTITINEDGYWVINGVVTTVKAQGNDGKDGTNGNDGTDGKDGVVLDNKSFMHVSFDDVQNCFSNLARNTYASLYDEPFFNWLKVLHDIYGAKFSLYTFNSALTNVPKTYAKEFLQAKDWLKIGLHATDTSSNFGSFTYEQGKSAWNEFVNNVVRITGSYLSVDRMPRLHTFAGSKDALKGMRDGNYGALGFLSADDARKSYYFDDAIKDYLYYNDHVTDYENGLVFVATDLRTDWFVGASGNNEYRKPTNNNAYDELVKRYTSVEYANSISSYILFGHEWQFYNGATLGAGKGYFEDACRFAKDYGIAFDFSQNKAFNPTPNDLYPKTVSGEKPQQTPTIVKYYETEMTVVDSINKMVFDPTVAPPGGAYGDFTTATVKGRATCVTAVLAVNGGETISFVSNLEEIFGSTKLSFAVLEFSSAPLSSAALSTTNSNAATAREWLTNPHTLQTNTRYVILSFKNSDGTVDFTTAQLAVLSKCLSIK